MRRFVFYFGAAFLAGQALEIRESLAAAAESGPGKTGLEGASACAPKLFQIPGQPQSPPPPQKISGQNSSAPLKRLNGSSRAAMPALSLPGQAAAQPLEEAWKTKALEALASSAAAGRPEAAARHFVVFLGNLASKSQLIDLRHEAPFFEELEAAGLRLMPDFRKQDLILIMQSYSRLRIRPGGKFISHWRAAAAKKKREFSSLDRYGLYGLFRDLGIPSLNAPPRGGGPAEAPAQGEINGRRTAAGSLEADVPAFALANAPAAGRKTGKAGGADEI